MANNPILYNAAVAGASSAITGSRWVTSSSQASYSAVANAISAFATALDAAIPAASPGQPEADLLESICSAFWSGRVPTGTSSSDYTGAASALAAVYAELSTKLQATTVETSNTALWVLDNNNLAQVWGYTETQISSDYSGLPAVALDASTAAPNVGVGHGLTVLPDGSLLIGHSETDGPQTDEGWLYIPASQCTPGTRELAGPPCIEWKCGQLRDVNAHTGARFGAVMPDGQLVIGRNYYARCSIDELLGAPDWRDSTLFYPTGGSGAIHGWDLQVDGSGNVWQCGEDSLWRVPGGMTASGSIAVDKIIKGSNIGYAGTIALDADGGMWVVDDDTNNLNYWDATAIDALTGVASNPAPTRTLEATGVTDLFSICLDRDGNAWVTDWTAPGKVHFFTAAQLAAGGVQAPTRSISTLDYPLCVRLAVGYGMYLR